MGLKKYPPLFIDTSAWIALNEKKDSHHKKARVFVKENKSGELNFGQIHTSEMILQETYTFLLYNYNYRAATEIVGGILESNVIIHPLGSLTFQEIWKSVSERKNGLSFVDWSTVWYMEKYGIDHIFTFDGDFPRVGYIKVPYC